VFELAIPKLLHGELRSDALVTRFFGFQPVVAAALWILLFLAAIKRLHAMRRATVPAGSFRLTSLR
jgi:hypothetical protein